MIMHRPEDMKCICGQDRYVTPGDHVKLGVVVGVAMEPDMRWARVVGILRKPTDRYHRVILREFKPQDRLWPTGRYVTSAFIVPWEHDHPRPDWGYVFR